MRADLIIFCRKVPCLSLVEDQCEWQIENFSFTSSSLFLLKYHTMNHKIYPQRQHWASQWISHIHWILQGSEPQKGVIEPQFDACASWWTQGPDKALQVNDLHTCCMNRTISTNFMGFFSWPFLGCDSPSACFLATFLMEESDCFY